MDKYLVMVDSTGNHNKYYRMTLSGNTLTCEYGRVGASPMVAKYPAHRYNAILSEKLRKGYSDMTDAHLAVVKTVSKSKSYRDIDDAEVRRFVDMLLEWADQTIAQNYTISASELTKEAVSKAQRILNILATGTRVLSVLEFNDQLEKLFVLIPRRMSCVETYLAKSPADFDKILVREQVLLDTIESRAVNAKGTVETSGDSCSPATSQKTILEENDLEIRKCTPDEIKMIKSKLDPDTLQKFKNAYHVVNKPQRERFDAYCKKKGVGKKDIKMLYHGSRNNCYWSILTTNLRLKPTMKVSRAGTMFGYGLYFATKAKKSAGYTSLQGTFWAHGSSKSAALLIYKVAMKRPKDVYQYSSQIATWDKRKAEAEGYDSVYAHASTNPSLSGGRLYNDECIVYDEDACTLSYVVELGI